MLFAQLKRIFRARPCCDCTSRAVPNSSSALAAIAQNLGRASAKLVRTASANSASPVRLRGPGVRFVTSFSSSEPSVAKQ